MAARIWLFFCMINAAWGILVPQSVTEPSTHALEAPHLNCWAAREVPRIWLRCSGSTKKKVDLGLIYSPSVQLEFGGHLETELLQPSFKDSDALTTLS